MHQTIACSSFLRYCGVVLCIICRHMYTYAYVFKILCNHNFDVIISLSLPIVKLPHSVVLCSTKLTKRINFSRSVESTHMICICISNMGDLISISINYYHQIILPLNIPFLLLHFMDKFHALWLH